MSLGVDEARWLRERLANLERRTRDRVVYGTMASSTTVTLDEGSQAIAIADKPFGLTLATGNRVRCTLVGGSTVSVDHRIS